MWSQQERWSNNYLFFFIGQSIRSRLLRTCKRSCLRSCFNFGSLNSFGNNVSDSSANLLLSISLPLYLSFVYYCKLYDKILCGSFELFSVYKFICGYVIHWSIIRNLISLPMIVFGCILTSSWTIHAWLCTRYYHCILKKKNIRWNESILRKLCQT